MSRLHLIWYPGESDDELPISNACPWVESGSASNPGSPGKPLLDLEALK